MPLVNLSQPSPPQNPPSRLKRIVSWVIAALVVWALAKTTNNAMQRLAEQDTATCVQIETLLQKSVAEAGDVRQTTLDDIAKLERSRLKLSTIRWGAVVWGAGLYGIALLAAATYWWRILIAFGYHPTARQAIAAHIIGHLGKYVPGKALVVIMRAAAISREQVPFSVAAIAAVVETLTFMAVGAAMAGAASLMLETPNWIRMLAIGLACCTITPTLPPLFRPLVNRLFTRRSQSIQLTEQTYSWRIMLIGWVLMSAAWTLTGLSFWCIIGSLPGVGSEVWQWRDGLLATAAISLAIVAGFMSLLPGGAGVRELVLVTLLGPRFGLPTALAAAIVARLAYLVTELVAFAICKFYLTKRG